jgi:hypothetical protein
MGVGTKRYIKTKCGFEGVGVLSCVGDHILQEFNTLFLLLQLFISPKGGPTFFRFFFFFKSLLCTLYRNIMVKRVLLWVAFRYVRVLRIKIAIKH